MGYQVDGSGNIFVTVTGNTALTAAQSGDKIMVNGADLTITLPPPAVNLQFTIISSAPTATLQGGSVGTNVAPNGTEEVIGNGFTVASGKGAVNTAGTAKIGDSITVVSDGTNWWITAVTGTWARHS